MCGCDSRGKFGARPARTEVSVQHRCHIHTSTDPIFTHCRKDKLKTSLQIFFDGQIQMKCMHLKYNKYPFRDTWTKLVPIGNTEAHNGYLHNEWRHCRAKIVFYTCSAFFVRIRCLWFSRNACNFKFHYTGEGYSPSPDSTPSFLKIKFYF